MPRILLIANYAPDGQYSMLRFAEMLEKSLPEAGCEVARAVPATILGRDRKTQGGLGKWLGYGDKYLLARRQLAAQARAFHPDIVHICDHSNAVYRPLFRDYRTLITCHDLLAIRVWRGEIPHEHKSLPGRLQQRWIARHLEQMPFVAADSEKTGEELRRLLPAFQGDLRVIPVGLHHPYHRLAEEEAAQTIAQCGLKTLTGAPLGDRWLLHVGNDSWYKNRPGVLEIFRTLKSKPGMATLQLLMAGAPPSAALQVACKGLEGDIAFLPHPSNAVLQALYSKAACFLFPSLAEGFGWPPLEAQACGCPVAISAIEPLRSNCGPAVYFDPLQPQDAAERIASLLADPAALQQLSAAGQKNAERFTPTAMCQAYRNYYDALLSTPP